VDYAASEGERLLIMDPGRAFGTGLHATTSLVADQLAKREAEIAGQTLLDVGTGSGILALVALRVGARAVDAFDIDPDAVSIARENAERNDLAAEINLWSGQVHDVDTRYACVVANIRTEVLLAERPALTAAVAARGWLIMSGILASEEDAITTAYAADFEHIETTRRLASAGDREPDAWLAIVMRRCS
jgi:ribosomal protein L11 methyltransferase